MAKYQNYVIGFEPASLYAEMACAVTYWQIADL